MVEELSPAGYLSLQQDGELWQLVDVRESWETEIAAIDGALHIPMSEIPARYRELDAAKPVALLCHSGARSARVAGFLAQQGFSRVANISGGIDQWSVEIDPAIPRY
ncbi:MAG: rhodanese-like domain-containing protein [Woeseia sp.]|nr:rhodanese-like domain-containing protein [Woeseiaceae bacterium]